MAVTAAQLQVVIDADAKGAEDALRRTEEGIRRLSGLGGLLSGLTAPIRSVVSGLGQIGLAAMGVQALVSSVGGLARSFIGGNVALENVHAQLLAFTKDGGAASQILEDIRAEAARTPFAFQEMASATAALLPAAKQSGVQLMELVRTAEILAALNPAQGLEGAAFALREALSGDFVSLVERFNLPRQRLNELKEQGVPAIEAVRIALQEMGADASLVSNLAATASGRWSTFVDTLAALRDTAAQPLFAALSSSLADLQRWLDANSERLQAFAASVGDKLAWAFTFARDSVVTFVQALSGNWQDAEGIAGLHRVIGNIGLVIRNTVIPAVTGFWNTVTQVIPAVKQELAEFFAALRGQQGESFGAKLGEGVKNTVDLIRNDVLPALKEFANWFTSEGLPAVQNFANTVTPVIQPVFGFLKENLPTIVPLLATFAGAFVGLQGATSVLGGLLGPLTQVFSILRGAMSITPLISGLVGVLGGPLTAAILGIAAIVAVAFMAWQNNWFGIRDIVNQVWSTVGPILGQIVSAIGQFIGQVVASWQAWATQIAPIAQQAWQNIQAAIQAVLSVLVPLITSVLSGIAGFIRNHGEEIKGILQGAWQIIRSVIETVMGVIQGIIKTILAVIAGDWGAAWDGIKQVASSIWDGIKTVIAGALDILKGVITIALEEIQRIWERIWGGLRDAAGRLLDGAKEAVSSGIEKIKQLFTGASEWLVEAGKDVVRGLINGITSMIDWAKQRAGELVSGVVSSVKSALGIRSPSRVMAEIGESVAQGLAQGIRTGAEQVALIAALLAERVTEAFVAIDADAAQGKAEAIRSIAQAVAELYSTVKELSGVDPDVMQVPAEMLEYLPAVARDLARGLEEGLRELSAERLKEVAGAARETVQAIADTLRFVHEAAAIDPDSLDVPSELLEYLPYVAASLAHSVEEAFREIATVNTEEYADAARNAVQALADVLRFARETAGIDPDKLVLPRQLLEYLPRMLRELMAALAAAAAPQADQIAAAVQSFDLLQKVFEGLRGILDGLGGRAGMGRDIVRIVQQIAYLGPAIAREMRGVAESVAEGMYGSGLAAGSRFLAGFRQALAGGAGVLQPQLQPQPVMGMGGAQPAADIHVRVYIGERELRDIIRVELAEVLR